eukprot:48720-Eustigmatos_ZCMA.PRE.1
MCVRERVRVLCSCVCLCNERLCVLSGAWYHEAVETCTDYDLLCRHTDTKRAWRKLLPAPERQLVDKGSLDVCEAGQEEDFREKYELLRSLGAEEHRS